MATIMANNTRIRKTQAVVSKAKYNSINWLTHFDYQTKLDDETDGDDVI